jgi:hypothetical protein
MGVGVGMMARAWVWVCRGIQKVEQKARRCVVMEGIPGGCKPGAWPACMHANNLHHVQHVVCNNSIWEPADKAAAACVCC